MQVEKKLQLKKRTKNLTNINQGFDSKGNNFLRRANRISLGSSNIFNKDDEKNKEENVKIVSINDILNSDIPMNDLNHKMNNINKENNVVDKSNKKEELEESKVKSNLNIENQNQRNPEEKAEIDPFFENNSVTLGYLNNKLDKLKKVSNNGGINYAMIDYISHLINLIESGIRIKSNIDNNIDYEPEEEVNIHKDKEIFSNSLIIICSLFSSTLIHEPKLHDFTITLPSSSMSRSTQIVGPLVLYKCLYCIRYLSNASMPPGNWGFTSACGSLYFSCHVAGSFSFHVHVSHAGLVYSSTFAVRLSFAFLAIFSLISLVEVFSCPETLSVENILVSLFVILVSTFSAIVSTRLFSSGVANTLIAIVATGMMYKAFVRIHGFDSDLSNIVIRFFSKL
jgi:hypothetical protein